MRTWIYTIRHGQTDFNRQKRYAGHLDIPLNDIGYKDTIEAAKKLEITGIAFDVVVTSSLQRAIKTAELLIKNTPIVSSALCNERNYGKMQGLTIDEVKLLRPKVAYIKVGGDTHSVNPPGGETFEILRKRAEQFREFIFKRWQGRKILIVSHGVFLQQFHGILLGKNCIESLAIIIPNLILSHFYIKDNIIISSGEMNLSNVAQINW